MYLPKLVVQICVLAVLFCVYWYEQCLILYYLFSVVVIHTMMWLLTVMWPLLLEKLVRFNVNVMVWKPFLPDELEHHLAMSQLDKLICWIFLCRLVKLIWPTGDRWPTHGSVNLLCYFINCHALYDDLLFVAIAWWHTAVFMALAMISRWSVEV